MRGNRLILNKPVDIGPGHLAEAHKGGAYLDFSDQQRAAELDDEWDWNQHQFSVYRYRNAAALHAQTVGEKVDAVIAKGRMPESLPASKPEIFAQVRVVREALRRKEMANCRARAAIYRVACERFQARVWRLFEASHKRDQSLIGRFVGSFKVSQDTAAFAVLYLRAMDPVADFENKGVGFLAPIKVEKLWDFNITVRPPAPPPRPTERELREVQQREFEDKRGTSEGMADDADHRAKILKLNEMHDAIRKQLAGQLDQSVPGYRARPTPTKESKSDEPAS
jgi:hypothetical protein